MIDTTLEELPGALPWRHTSRVHLQDSATTELLVDTALAVYGHLLPSWSADAGERLAVTTSRTPTGWRVHVTSSTQGITFRIHRSGGYRDVHRVRAALALIIAGSDRRRAETFARAWGVQLWVCPAPGCARRFSRWSTAVWHERLRGHRRVSVSGS